MDDLKLIVAPSPHIRDIDTTEKFMFGVVAALLPVMAASIYFFGWNAVRVLLLGAAGAIATEAIFQRLRKQPIRIGDGSALVTGLLVGLIVPPSLPSIMVGTEPLQPRFGRACHFDRLVCWCYDHMDQTF